MLSSSARLVAAALVAVAAVSVQATTLNFTIHNGQIFTPGLAVLNAPQPGTPLGGKLLEVALDVSANGKLQLPPYPQDTPSRFNNITIFLQSYVTGRNLTITNGTASAGNSSLGDVMLSEPGSTVKHVKWIWPECLMGDGQPGSSESARGQYNISIRQNFLLNGKPHYTIFNVPISVTNSIQPITDGSPGQFSGEGGQGGRPSCDALNNPLAPPEQADEAFVASTKDVGVLFAPGDATTIQQTFAPPGSGASLSIRAPPQLGVALGMVVLGAVSW
ncbi:hypothetical protein Micbo1qcDRAFT_201149 [Microdochium bolleyi]|uniref:Uncharacterized protein n=1 Tax=Microdochium bolleyi TaxID=196109 RepID=A0A136JF64_9PEZI|nr:hypothetical protein Micbo1qcDRAFT_201149 [Microdochium bolleyi]